MGLDTNGLKFLLYAKNNGIIFNKILTLGRQSYQLSEGQLQSILEKSNHPQQEIAGLVKSFDYVEPLLLQLGATHVDSMDVSNYEHATLLHDLNCPVTDDLKGKFDTILDAGTLEHVFNFPTAIKNCMQMLKVNGYFLGITCANNFSGHGFYQFSPELFFRVFSEENGFETKNIFFVINEPGNYWYEVTDPKEIRKRVVFENSKQTFLYIIARKIAQKEVFALVPQQSDYQHLAWKGKDQVLVQKKNIIQKLFFFLSDDARKNIRRRLRFIDPKALKVFVRDMGNSKKGELRKTKIS